MTEAINNISEIVLQFYRDWEATQTASSRGPKREATKQDISEFIIETFHSRPLSPVIGPFVHLTKTNGEDEALDEIAVEHASYMCKELIVPFINSKYYFEEALVNDMSIDEDGRFLIMVNGRELTA